MSHSNTLKAPAYFANEDLSISDFAALCQQTVELKDYPLAKDVEKNIVIYEAASLRELLADEAGEAQIKSEFTHCLKDGPGVFVIKGAFADTSVLDECTAVFARIVAREKAAGAGKGDHFGTNERIWNSVQKTCLESPALFIEYYGNPFLAIASEAWLGPYYQMTAQMNTVKPGGTAQSAHRDYHLGFQSRQTIRQFPAHAQMMSQYLTLQGAIAHGDMPIVTGPTLFLPFSQAYPAGYLAFREPEFAAYFDEHKVQIPFEKGDMVFFSPALFHGAGTNQSENDRVANLVQISSAFGRTMETINTYAMIEASYPALLQRVEEGTIEDRQLSDVIASLADGYSFPTNLDSDPPIGGNAPETAQQMVKRALDSRWSAEQLQAELNAYAARRLA